MYIKQQIYQKHFYFLLMLQTRLNQFKAYLPGVEI